MVLNNSDLIDMFARLATAVILGGLIGIERQSTNRPAGLRTHIIVCLGATLVMYTNILMCHQYKDIFSMDPTRIGAQVVSGIGFIGAGTIMKEGPTVKGLTTAATLWAVGCLGLAIGSGYIELSFIATIFMLLVLQTLGKLEEKAIKYRREAILYIEVTGEKSRLENVNKVLIDSECRVKSLSMNIVTVGTFGMKILIRYPKHVEALELMAKVATVEGVVSIEKLDQ